MDECTLSTCYQMIAELLLNPEDRDGKKPEEYQKHLLSLHALPIHVHDLLESFLINPSAFSVEEYVTTLELSPPCPLYIGAYLFEEPTTCRGAGMSGRNIYMIELVNLYRHFACEFVGKELADHLPVMVDFLWLSMEQKHHDKIGLRRRFVEHYLMPGITPMIEKLEKFQSTYANLLKTLNELLKRDIEKMKHIPMWVPEVSS